MTDSEATQPAKSNAPRRIDRVIGCVGCLGLVVLVNFFVLPFSCIPIPQARVWAHAREVVRPEIVFFPDGQRLLFVKIENRRAEIMLLSIADGSIRPLQPGKPAQFSPRITPDGRHVIFCESNGKWRAKLYALDMTDGTVQTLSAKGDQAAYWPTVSPQGNSVAYASVQKSGKSTIRMVSLDAMKHKDITEPGYVDILPAFDPKGEMIVFWSSDRYGHASPVAAKAFHDWTLCVVQLDQLKARKLSGRKFYNIEYRQPVFTNKFSYFGISSYEPKNPWRTQWQFSDAPEPTELPSEFSELVDEDGSPLAVVQNPKPFGDDLLVEITLTGQLFAKEDPGEIYILDTEDNNVQQVTSLGKVISDFALSPDKTKIVVLTDRHEVWVVDIQTQAATKVH